MVATASQSFDQQLTLCSTVDRGQKTKNRAISNYEKLSRAEYNLPVYNLFKIHSCMVDNELVKGIFGLAYREERETKDNSELKTKFIVV